MTTDNKNSARLYIVRFGNSDQYLLHDISDLASVETELNTYLREKFPDETFAYFTTPKVTEISPEHESQFVSYPALDANAVEAIKAVLVKEVEVMEANKEIDSNAPFANVNPAAADISHILG
ncbi:MAG: hypothetical protein HDR80_09490 [Bacteroides sp.]|nr:hypothetical protein [Bacteroides sp.]